jgi:hypothetical protein
METEESGFQDTIQTQNTPDSGEADPVSKWPVKVKFRNKVLARVYRPCKGRDNYRVAMPSLITFKGDAATDGLFLLSHVNNAAPAFPPLFGAACSWRMRELSASSSSATGTLTLTVGWSASPSIGRRSNPLRMVFREPILKHGPSARCALLIKS